MIKVQDQNTEDMDWEQVRNIIIKIDNESRLYDSYKKRERIYANGAQPKICRACGKKGHMTAICLVPKDKLYCKHSNLKNSRNTSARFKKQKEDKEKKKLLKEDKSGKEKPPSSLVRNETSEER